MMADYQILFSKSAQKDIAQLTSQQKAKLKKILQDVISKNPVLYPPAPPPPPLVPPEPPPATTKYSTIPLNAF